MEPPLVQIGDITVTQTSVITPSGAFPVAGSQWSVTDGSRTTESISTVGMILAIVGFLVVCALSLLFLLMKESKTTGYIQVVVRGTNGVVHTTNIPATSPMAMPNTSAQVNYARSIAALA